jgi:hypothetical protein
MYAAAWVIRAQVVAPSASRSKLAPFSMGTAAATQVVVLRSHRGGSLFFCPARFPAVNSYLRGEIDNLGTVTTEASVR